MDRGRHVFGHCTHFDRQDAFGDEFARADAAESHTKDPAGLSIEHEFCEALVATQRRGATTGRPREARDRDGSSR